MIPGVLVWEDVRGDIAAPSVRCRFCGGTSQLTLDGDTFAHRDPALCNTNPRR